VNPRNFFSELKRRNVYKVAIAYGVVAWLLLQAASILFPTFEAESLRDYAKDAAVLDRILALKPNDLDARLARGQLEVAWKADTRLLHEVIESFIQQNPASSARLAPLRIFLASAERDAGAAERALADLGDDTYGPDAIQFSRAFGEGQLARWKGDASAAHASFTTARAAQQRIVDAQPDYGPALCVLGLIDAGLGRKEDALREGRRAVELTPPSKDSINGPIIMGFLPSSVRGSEKKIWRSTSSRRLFNFPAA
jgi:tetratricopeptide (TPR) repeat protein